MLKFKDSKKKFTIIYSTEDMTENYVLDGKVLTKEEYDLVLMGDLNRGDIFILDSDDDIDEWNEMMEFLTEDEEGWNENAEDLGLSNYFTFES